MDLDTASGLLSGQPAEVSEHRAMLANRYVDEPQRGMLCDLAMRAIEESLAVLAKHGHRYKLVENPVEEPEQFPMMVYSDGQRGLVHLTVENQEQLDEMLGQGFRVHPSKEPVQAVAMTGATGATAGTGSTGTTGATGHYDLGRGPPSYGSTGMTGGNNSPLHPDANLPVPGAAGAGANTGLDNLVSSTDEAQRENLDEAIEQVEHHS